VSTPSPDTFDYPFFSLDHAGGWIDVTQPRLLLDLPEQRALIPNVSFARRTEPAGKLEPMVAGAILQLERDTNMVDLDIDPVEDLEVAGVAAKLVRFTFTVPLPAEDGALHPAESPRMCCAQVHLLHNGMGFLITFTAEASGFGDAEPHFRELLASFQFRVPA